MRQNREVWDSLSEAEKKERAGELRRLREKQREIPSKQFRDETYKNLQYIRYADDFIISIIGSKKDAEALKADLAVSHLQGTPPVEPSFLDSVRGIRMALCWFPLSGNP